MNEQRIPNREIQPGAGGSARIFAGDEDTSLQLVTVSSGPFAEQLSVGDMTVGEIRRRFRDRFDIDPRSVAVVDVGDDTTVRAAQVLTFVHRAGEKGGAVHTAIKAGRNTHQIRSLGAAIAAMRETREQ